MKVKNDSRSKLQNISLIIGIIIFLILQILPKPEGLNELGYKVLTVAIIMVIFWITEAIPIAATALLPILLFPILGITGAKDENEIRLFSLYGYKTIFLVLGAGFLASAMQRWNLHRRIALKIVKIVGSNVKMIILGFILAVSFISMWMSNTTATVMMLPVAMSIVSSLGKLEIFKSFDASYTICINFRWNGDFNWNYN